MIPVTPRPEPANFDKDVRRPGQRYLRHVPHPNNDQFKRHQYWRNALPELRAAYNEICAYCACWIPFDSGTVDHYVPKCTDPPQAYEWANFRLAQEKLNNAKGESTDVLDPFTVHPGWFVLDMATMFVKPNTGLPPAVETAVKNSIAILRLNSNTLVRLRYKVLKEYSDGIMPMAFLEHYYPFIAAELSRQGVADSIKGTVK